MYQTGISAFFSAAHFLKNYRGKCENLHGHNWRVEVVVEGDTLDAAGMGLDFTILRRHTAEVLNELDHTVINDLPAFSEKNPSAENLACYLFSRLDEKISGEPVNLVAVRVWESEYSWAEYRP